MRQNDIDNDNPADKADKPEQLSSRRKLLCGLVAGGGIAGTAAVTQWQKPVVQSVLLPAHATTSAPQTGDPLRVFALSGAVMAQRDLDPGELYASVTSSPQSSILDTLISPAQAGTTDQMFEIVIRETGPDLFSLQLLISSNFIDINNPGAICTTYRLTTASNLAVGPMDTGIEESCRPFVIDRIVTVLLSSVSASEATISVDGDTYSGVARVGGASNLTLPACPCADPVDDL